MREFPTEVRADLQRFYSLNLDKMGTDYTVLHAAACVRCLPASSATVARKLGTGLTLQDVPLQILFKRQTEDNVMDDVQEMSIEELDALLNNTEWRDIDGREYR